MLGEAELDVDPSAPGADQAAPASETAGATAVSPPRWTKPSRRRVVAVLVALGLLVLGYQPLAGQLIASNRQRHLAADFGTPSPTVGRGGAVAVLQIPSLAVNDVVVNGDDVDQLRGGPGLVPGTALPGTAGTSVIVGHRTSYGGPFVALDRLQVGNRVTVRTRNLRAVAYVVTAIATVASNRIDEVPADGANGAPARLLLVTESDSGSGDDLLVVTATAAVTGTGPALDGGQRIAPESSSLDLERLLVSLLAGLIGVLGVLLARPRDRRLLAVCLLPVWGASWVFAVMAVEPMLGPLR